MSICDFGTYTENIIFVIVENFNIMPPIDTFFFRGSLYKDKKVLIKFVTKKSKSIKKLNNYF